MEKKYSRKGQTTLEYVVLIVVVIAALIAMSVYLKRGISGRVRQTADEIGEQYEPKKTFSSVTTGLTGTTTSSATEGITSTWIDVNGNGIHDAGEDFYPLYQSETSTETNTRSGTENVEAF